MATQKVIKSQKTEVYWASAPTVATRAVCVSSIGGLGGPRSQIPTTCLDDEEDETFVGGLGSPGQVTLAFNVHKAELSHEALLALKASGAEVSWGIYSSGTPAPTAVDSEMQAVAGRVSAIFLGYVADVGVEIGANDIWKGAITIQRSGPIAWDLQTA